MKKLYSTLIRLDPNNLSYDLFYSSRTPIALTVATAVYLEKSMHSPSRPDFALRRLSKIGNLAIGEFKLQNEVDSFKMYLFYIHNGNGLYFSTAVTEMYGIHVFHPKHFHVRGPVATTVSHRYLLVFTLFDAYIFSDTIANFVRAVVTKLRWRIMVLTEPCQLL